MTEADGPLKHIRRRQLPWRDSGLTECGRAVSAFAADVVLHTDDVDEVVKRHGLKRAAFLLCITCFEQWKSWARPWRDDGLFGNLARDGQSQQGKAEVNLDLRAIAELVRRHREEFEGIRDAFAGLTDAEIAAITQVRIAQEAQS